MDPRSSLVHFTSAGNDFFRRVNTIMRCLFTLTVPVSFLFSFNAQLHQQSFQTAASSAQAANASQGHQAARGEGGPVPSFVCGGEHRGIKSMLDGRMAKSD